MAVSEKLSTFIKYFLADVSDWLVVETLSMKVSGHAQ